MTVVEAWEKLVDLMMEGHGKKKIGYFSHRDGNFIECGDIRVTKNGGYYEEPGTEKTEEVVQVTAK